MPGRHRRIPDSRLLSAREKCLLAAYIPQTDLDRAIIHDTVPWYLLKGFVGITRGRHIYFRTGAYDPASPAGLGLLGHELVHVGQYRRGMTAFRYLCASFRGYRNNPYEKEAFAVEARILQSLGAGQVRDR